MNPYFFNIYIIYPTGRVLANFYFADPYPYPFLRLPDQHLSGQEKSDRIFYFSDRIESGWSGFGSDRVFCPPLPSEAIDFFAQNIIIFFDKFSVINFPLICNCANDTESFELSTWS